MNKMNKDIVEYSGNSAVFHVGIGLMLFSRGLSFIIKQVNNDDNESRGLKINDEISLKQKLLKNIEKKYNTRISKHNIKYKKISDNHLDKLNIIKYRFLKDSANDDPSGVYSLFPNAFVCKKCGHYIINQSLHNFNPKECKLCKDGEYEQISLLRFCEECGKIDKFYYQCKKDKSHGTKYIKLLRDDKDNLLTWKFTCSKCTNYKPVDIFDPFFMCKHQIKVNGNKIKDGSKKFKPITIRESGIFSPVVVTNIDLPKTEKISDTKIDKELIMLGFHLNKFDIIEKVNNIFDVYKILRSYELQSELGYDISERLKKDSEQIYEILIQIKEFERDIPVDVLKEFNELSILNGTAGTVKQVSEFSKYIKEHERNDLVIKEKIEYYNKILETYGIKQVNYLSNVKVINSLIGIIKGINRFWEKDEHDEQKIPPHFEIFWKSLAEELIWNKPVDRDNEHFSVYSYPFETEGILIEFKPEKICSWLYDNKLVDSPIPSNDAKNFLLKLNPSENKCTYNYINTLLHTFSHILMKKIHLFTGMGIDSCGEKIFTNGGSIFLYSNNNLNIGALQFLLENNMFTTGGIFENLKQEVKDCSFDPLCMNEKGACFSCLYIPEFVCCNFNLNLDRNVFVGNGKRKIKKSYWGP